MLTVDCIQIFADFPKSKLAPEIKILAVIGGVGGTQEARYVRMLYKVCAHAVQGVLLCTSNIYDDYNFPLCQ
jgi:hypothetical protein